MTDADTHRATPGYVYDVAMHSSGEMEPYTPECSCPCHLSKSSPRSCPECGTFTVSTHPESLVDHDAAVISGRENPKQPMRPVVDHYFITKGNTLSDELGEHFETQKEADARADKLNEEDVIASLGLGKKLERRLRRFRDLATHDWSWSSDFGWAHKPGRYAVETYYDGSSSWSTEDSLAEIEAEIERGDVERVVDLDSGEDVPFTRTVTVSLEAS